MTVRTEKATMSKSGNKKVPAVNDSDASKVKLPAKKHLSVNLSTLFSLLLVVGVCLLIYVPTIHYQFTNLDDSTIIQNIAQNVAHPEYSFTRDAFMRSGANGFYRPLQSLTFFMDCVVGNGDPDACHRTNLIIFCLGCCALLLLLRKLGFASKVALAAVFVFAVHPLFVQAVAWIPARGDLLLFFFGTLSVVWLIDFEKSGHWFYGVLHLLAFTLAVLAKETGVVLVGVFCVYLAGYREDKTRLARRHLFIPVAWIVIIAGFLVLRTMVVPSLPDGNQFGIRPLLANLAVIPETITNFFWPIGISVLPSFTVVRTLVGLVLLSVIAASVFMYKSRRLSMVIVGSTWFLSTLLPGMMYRFGTDGIMYDYLNHRSLFPMVGFLVVLMEVVPQQWLLSKNAIRKTCVLMILCVLAILSWNQSGVFATPGTFFDQAVRTNPRSALAFKGRGSAKQNSGDLNGALQDYDQALRLYPDLPRALYDRSSVKSAMGDYAGALVDIDRLLRVQPADANLLHKRAKIECAMGDYAGALKTYDNALLIEKNDVDLYNERATLRQMKRDFNGALADIVEASALNPQSSALIYNIGLVKFNMGDTAGACKAWQKSDAMGCEPARGMLKRFCK
jgi:Flp pilus assembly protein TadD